MKFPLPRSSRIILAVALAAGAVWVGRSTAQVPKTDGPPGVRPGPGGAQAQGSRIGPMQLRHLGQFVKVGKYRLSVDQILYTRDDGKDLIIRFGDGRDLTLQDADAELLRHWLDAGATYPQDTP